MTGYPPADNADRDRLDDLLKLLEFDRVDGADTLPDEEDFSPGDAWQE